MNRTFKKGNNWTKLIAALVFMCSVFGFTAMAQTKPDKPLDTKSHAALVEELKGIVAKSSPNEKDAELVADRWGKRTDLRGKTKKEVIKDLDGKKIVIKKPK